MAEHDGKLDVHATLTANSVDRCVLSGRASQFLVINRTGTSEIYFTYAVTGGADPIDPVIAAAETMVVPASVGAAVKVTLSINDPGVIVKLISSGTMAYSIEAVA